MFCFLEVNFDNELTIVPGGRAIKRSSLEREISPSYLRPVKSDAVLPTACHRCDITSKDTEFLGAMTQRCASPTHYTLRRNTASIMKGLIKYYALKSKKKLLHSINNSVNMTVLFRHIM